MEPLSQPSPQDRETGATVRQTELQSMGRSGEMEQRYFRSKGSRHELGRDAWTVSPQCAYSEVVQKEGQRQEHRGHRPYLRLRLAPLQAQLSVLHTERPWDRWRTGNATLRRSILGTCRRASSGVPNLFGLS